MTHGLEPRLTTTLVIQSPRYYGHFFSARQNGHPFSYKKKPLMGSLFNSGAPWVKKCGKLPIGENWVIT